MTTFSSRILSALAIAALAAAPARADFTVPASVPPANATGVQAVFAKGGAIPRSPEVKGTFQRDGLKTAEGKSYSVVFGLKDPGKRWGATQDPFKLPNGVYTYVILTTGGTLYGHPADKWEVGTRHAHLAQGKTVAASGELIKGNDSIKLNVLSGTFMIPLITANKWDPQDLLRRVTYWFDKVLRKKFKGAARVKVSGPNGSASFNQLAIFDAPGVLKPPGAAAVAGYCKNAAFKANNSKQVTDSKTHGKSDTPCMAFGAAKGSGSKGAGSKPTKGGGSKPKKG